ncbi:MAG: hypothetical protein WB810_09120, partial [Candidatus Cybelea sp.]
LRPFVGSTNSWPSDGGIHRLSRYAVERVPAKTLVDGSKRPLQWSASTITRLIANRSYLGTVVEADLWDRVVALLQLGPNRGAPRWPWPLRGAVRCTCGCYSPSPRPGTSRVGRAITFAGAPPNTGGIRITTPTARKRGATRSSPPLSANSLTPTRALRKRTTFALSSLAFRRFGGRSRFRRNARWRRQSPLASAAFGPSQINQAFFSIRRANRDDANVHLFENMRGVDTR